MSGLIHLETLLKNGSITRREFIRRASILGLAAAAAPGLLSHPVEAATQKRGGRFRAGLPEFSTTASLDPATLSSAADVFITWQLRNCLVEIDYKGNATPELADTIESSPDATTWRFTLRKGVEFHNGKTLDTNDVIDSINYHRAKESKSAVKSLVEPIKDIRADGKDTVIFELTGGNADFPYILADFHLTISPAGTRGADLNKGIGTGGYILQEFEPGVRVFAGRNPNYWKSDRAHFDEVETLGIMDTNARTNALKTGQVDWIARCDLKIIHMLEKMPGIQVIRIPGAQHLTLPMLMDVAPYDNNDVRLALKYAIDREQIVKTVFRGYGTVGNDHPIASIQRFYAADLPQREYDPEKAKFHLKKAGLENHTFTLHTSTFFNFLDCAVLYQEHAAKAGITIDLVREPADGYWSNIWMKKPWVSCTWGGRATEDLMLSTAYAGDAPWNDSHFQHKRFNTLPERCPCRVG